MLNEIGKLDKLAGFHKAFSSRKKLISFCNNQAAISKVKLFGGGCLFFVVNVCLGKPKVKLFLKFLLNQDMLKRLHIYLCPKGNSR